MPTSARKNVTHSPKYYKKRNVVPLGRCGHRPLQTKLKQSDKLKFDYLRIRKNPPVETGGFSVEFRRILLSFAGFQLFGHGCHSLLVQIIDQTQTDEQHNTGILSTCPAVAPDSVVIFSSKSSISSCE